MLEILEILDTERAVNEDGLIAYYFHDNLKLLYNPKTEKWWVESSSETVSNKGDKLELLTYMLDDIIKQTEELKDKLGRLCHCEACNLTYRDSIVHKHCFTCDVVLDQNNAHDEWEYCKECIEEHL